MAKFLYPLIVLSNHQNYFSRNHVRLGDIEARLPIDRSSTSYEDQEHGTNLVGRHLTISISKYDLKSDIDIDEIDIEDVEDKNIVTALPCLRKSGASAEEIRRSAVEASSLSGPFKNTFY